MRPPFLHVDIGYINPKLQNHYKDKLGVLATYKHIFFEIKNKSWVGPSFYLLQYRIFYNISS